MAGCDAGAQDTPYASCIFLFSDAADVRAILHGAPHPKQYFIDIQRVSTKPATTCAPAVPASRAPVPAIPPPG